MPFLRPNSPDMLLNGATSVGRGIGVSKTPQMEVRPQEHCGERTESSIPHVNSFYDNSDSESSVRSLVYKIRPEWQGIPNELELTKFTDGITNTLLRVARRRPGATQEEVDKESVLMRAYGNNTDLIIDRDREAQSHALLADKGMAPPLLARFNNGLLYAFVPGKVCTPEDLTSDKIWRGVAKKLGEWHARIPISAISSQQPQHRDDYPDGHVNGVTKSRNGVYQQSNKLPRPLESRSPTPNLWSVLQNWVDTLSTNTEKERARKTLLQHEIERSFRELDTINDIGEQGLVFGHLDLLSANVIMLPTEPDATPSPHASLPVTFIDYEYATPCPAAYDIANHFAEWAGYDLDYNRIPTKSTRRAFLTEYLASYNQFASLKVNESILDSLEKQVDRFRGMPGLYWGIWALIQARISEIDFDYAQYAEDRLDEYWAWRAELNGTRAAAGKMMPLREQRWAQEI